MTAILGGLEPISRELFRESIKGYNRIRHSYMIQRTAGDPKNVTKIIINEAEKYALSIVESAIFDRPYAAGDDDGK